MSEPSERMQALVRTLRHAQHQAARTNTVTEDLVVADMELCSAIAELEQRAEKWKRVAVAKQTVEMLRLAHKPIRAAEFQEVRDAIADLGDEWTEATR